MTDIIAAGLYKRFGDNEVLEDFSAVFKAGEVTCMMGPSGFGKTTLLNILMGLTAPDAGTVTGVPTLKSAVFQEDRLCESFGALANIRLVCDPEISDEKILEHLNTIGLEDSFDKSVGEFSGGMKRRVAIVRAMLAKSDILFLDEPFKGLDDETKLDTIRYVKENLNGRTVVMVTHSTDECRLMGGRLITIGRRDTAEED